MSSSIKVKRFEIAVLRAWACLAVVKDSIRGPSDDAIGLKLLFWRTVDIHEGAKEKVLSANGGAFIALKGGVLNVSGRVNRVAP